MVTQKIKLNSRFDSLKQWVEPHFVYAGHNKLQIATECVSSRQMDYLNSLIVGKNNNITAHVRKIMLLKDTNADTKVVFAAFIDFFTVLKNNGSDIKKRLLNSCQPNLTKEHLDDLASYLNAGKIEVNDINAGCRLKEIEELLLFDLGKNKKFIKVEKINKATPYENDLKLMVHNYMENSQIDLAIAALEGALLENPKIIEMGELLMQLYKGTNDKEAFSFLHDKVVGKLSYGEQKKLPQYWNETLSYFIEKGSV